MKKKQAGFVGKLKQLIVKDLNNMQELRQLLIFFLLLIFVSSCGAPEDSSNSSEGDGVAAGEYRIFITSTAFNGNLGGVDGANTKCASLAKQTGLKRKYIAIISSTSQHIVDTINALGEIFTVSKSGKKVKIANSDTDLFNSFSQPLLNNINVDESGNTVQGKTPWTGSLAAGTHDGDSCDNWSDAGTFDGVIGSSEEKDMNWIENTFVSCSEEHPLYCISQ